MDTKQCSTCHRVLTTDKFGKNRFKKSGLQSQCKECDCKYKSKKYQENKEIYKERSRKKRQEAFKWLKDYKKDLSCSNCGDNRWYVLDFHHKDQKEKEFEISEMVGCYGINRILKEIEKCDVLCANCHREKHYLE